MVTMENKEILSKLQELGLTQKYLSKIFRRRPQQVFSAIYNGDQPTLRNKIIKHIKLKEVKNESKGNQA